MAGTSTAWRGWPIGCGRCASPITPASPARRPFRGSLHPVTQTRRDLTRIFQSMGYSVEVGPEVVAAFENSSHGLSHDQLAACLRKGREDRWHIEYPATNNAVGNGGLVALAVWFGLPTMKPMRWCPSDSTWRVISQAA